MKRADEVIKRIEEETDSIILMHSLSGKDSIALLDMLYGRFKRIVCCFMYVVPNLEHLNRYYSYARRKYPNVEWIQVPHYGVFTYRKHGYMGKEGNPKQRQWKLADIIDKVREKVGIEWVCLGFKQTDSFNRLLMLRSYKDGMEAISWSGKKFYPLSTYTNKDVLEYIAKMKLKNPESYGGKAQSAGTNITDYYYLDYLRKNFPNDFNKIKSEYPAITIILDKYEREHNEDNKEESD